MIYEEISTQNLYIGLWMDWVNIWIELLEKWELYNKLAEM